MSDNSAPQAQGTTDAVDATERPDSAAWWLSTRRRRHEWQSLMATGQATFSGRPRSHFEQARPGDPVLIYVSKPEHLIRAVGVVTATSNTEPNPKSKIQNLKSHDPCIEVQLAFEVPSPLSWRDILAVPALAEAEPVKQRSSATLSRMNSDEYAALQALIIVRNPELAGAFAAIDAGALLPGTDTDAYAQDGHGEMGDLESVPEVSQAVLREQAVAYASQQAQAQRVVSSVPPVRSLAELQEMTGMPAEMLEEARDLLEDTGQIVLSGPPGTGKTWLARGLASLVAGSPAGARVQVVQFHPSTSYEDFIEGLKPRVDAWGRVTYAVLPGIFVRMCEQARNDPEHHYVLLIDEINRAPLARVFGELLYALEYRGPQGAVELSVSAGVGEHEPFYVPENLLLIGTMNSADRSIALVDYALRRRFRFIELEPNPAVLDMWLAARGNDVRCRRIVLDLLREMNVRLSEALDPDHRLGHTYFMLDPLTPTTLDRLWRTAVRPLITEYFLPPAAEVEEYRALFEETVRQLSE